MEYKIPKKLLGFAYRMEMWENAKKIIEKVQRVLPLNSIYVLGSFTTKKRRPADVDFIVTLRVSQKKKSKWSTDFVIIPDNKYGNLVLDDTKKWMKQKYGIKNSAVIKLK